MTVRILILTLMLPSIPFCQKTISGKVIDKSSGSPVAYSTIGLLKQNIGTNADEDGSFSFVADFNVTDTLIVSAVGYETLKVSASKVKIDPVIQLEKRILALSEIFVTSKSNWKYSVLNKLDCSNSGITTNGFTTQIAQRFHSPAKNCQLTEIEICTNYPPFVAKEAKFRIRIYDIDSLTGSPSSDLTNEIIDVNSHTKIVRVDVEKWKIHIPNKQFFIAVEWIKIPYNEQKKGKNSAEITYNPSISFKEGKADKKEIWMLTYQNIWFSGFQNSRAAISVKVKY